MSGPSGPESSGADKDPVSRTDETDIHSRAYSAPESEQFSSAPYVPPDPALYDYDAYPAYDEDIKPPRWPWVVGVVAIVAAIALVASVALLVTRTDDSDNLRIRRRRPRRRRRRCRTRSPRRPPPPTDASRRLRRRRGAASATAGDGHRDRGAAPRLRRRARNRTAAGDHRGAATRAAHHHPAGRTATGHVLGHRAPRLRETSSPSPTSTRPVAAGPSASPTTRGR